MTLEEASRVIAELTIERLGLHKRINDHDTILAQLSDTIRERNELARQDFNKIQKLETELAIYKMEADRLKALNIYYVGMFKGIAYETDYCYICDRHPSAGHGLDCAARVSYYDTNGKLL